MKDNKIIIIIIYILSRKGKHNNNIAISFPSDKVQPGEIYVGK